MSAEIADVLDRAADRIERDGWWQGGYYQGSAEEIATTPLRIALRVTSRPCCAIAAVMAEAPSRHMSHLAERALERFLGVPLVTVWNDAPERTQAEVVAAIRGAAAQERGAS